VLTYEAIKSGGTDVDRNFHAWCLETFGVGFSSLPREKVGAGSLFMDAFEEIKCEYRGGEDDDALFYIALRMPKKDSDDPKVQAAYDMDESRIKLHG
jgi:hypothetical protein